MQHKRMPVESPWLSSVLEKRRTRRVKAPSMSSAVPMTLPTARLAMNSTGKRLTERFFTTVCVPRKTAAKPMAV